MCGICGFSWSDEAALAAMLPLLRHRGPDASGTLVEAGVSLGHTRLSIIDLTETGRQPMRTEDGRFAIVFNGEVYNFQQVRAELEELGEHFVGSCDTEVLLRGFARWGEALLPRLNGMWAAAIHDRETGRLLLTRDRLGVKPLYYALTDDGLVFASELPPILPFLPERRIDSTSVDLLLSSQFVPSPKTIYLGVSKLEPRETLEYDLDRRMVTRRFHWDVPAFAPEHDRAALVREGRELLADATRLRMIADVPLGAFLSGGLDSSAIVGAMRRKVDGKDLHTVSAGFDLPGLDETPFIEIVRNANQTTHHHVEFATDDVDAALRAAVAACPEPIADHSTLPMLQLCEEARRWMTVALSGDGADEVFGGYSSRQVVRSFQRLLGIPRPLRRFAHACLRATIGYDLRGVGRITEALRVSLLPQEDYFAEIGATCVHRPEAFKDWARTRLRELLEKTDGDLLEAMLKFDIHYNRLGDNYCAKVDAMSMAHSLEVRSPFLDYRFVEFAARVPTKWKLDDRETKILMREIVSDLVPEEILHRAKHGFAAPLGVWAEAHRDELRDAVDVLIEAGVLRETWRRFLLDEVLVQDAEPACREFGKRLAFFWVWYQHWIVGAPPLTTAAAAGLEMPSAPGS